MKTKQFGIDFSDALVEFSCRALCVELSENDGPQTDQRNDVNHKVHLGLLKAKQVDIDFGSTGGRNTTGNDAQQKRRV